MNHLSLFAGAGMLDLALEQLGHRTIATAEIDPFCRQILAARFPHAQHLTDVKDVKLSALTEPVDIATGGFPCQDLASLGAGAGIHGTRSGLWSEFARVLEEVRPKYAMIENVPMLRSRGLHVILCDLYRLGYDARWDCIPAASVGAPHMRDRLWIGCTHKSTDRLRVPSQVLGWVRADGISDNKTNPVTSFPRAAEMLGGVIVSTKPRHRQKDARAGREMWPTPRSSLNEWRTTRNAPSHGRTHGATLAGTVNDLERAAGRTVGSTSESAGNVNADWVEWLMGLPQGWTNPSVPNSHLIPHNGWTKEPSVPRTLSGPEHPNRAARLRALGNGLVPQAAKEAMSYLLPGAIHESDTSQASASA